MIGGVAERALVAELRATITAAEVAKAPDPFVRGGDRTILIAAPEVVDLPSRERVVETLAQTEARAVGAWRGPGEAKPLMDAPAAAGESAPDARSSAIGAVFVLSGITHPRGRQAHGLPARQLRARGDLARRVRDGRRRRHPRGDVRDRDRAARRPRQSRRGRGGAGADRQDRARDRGARAGQRVDLGRRRDARCRDRAAARLPEDGGVAARRRARDRDVEGQPPRSRRRRAQEGRGRVRARGRRRAVPEQRPPRPEG